MEILIIIAVAAVAAVVTWMVTKSFMKSQFEKDLIHNESVSKMELATMETEKKNALEQLARNDQLHERQVAELKASHEKLLADQKQNYEKQLADAKENYNQTLQEVKKAQEESIKAAKTELELKNEENLRAKEEALKKEAQESFKNITQGFAQDVKNMKESFEAQKKAHTEETGSLKSKFEETVKHLNERTMEIGHQADNLANAIKGQNKMQGIFGETILENILTKEGMQKGRDYDSECYLRDKHGAIIANEDTNKKMRPDFVLHFPDNTDILVDSKVSLVALSEYFEASTDEQRKEAQKKNLESVLNHIKELTDKEYQKYVVGRKTLDYVIMFIPNYGAYQLAKQEDPEIFAKAFAQNVLLTTDETLIPFLRLIRSAWVQKDQVENMGKIVDGASKMVDRVAKFCEENAKIGEKLENTLNQFKANTNRLIDGPQSIVKAAKEVVACGVKLDPKKSLPE